LGQRRSAVGRSAPVDADRPGGDLSLYFGLLGHLQGVIHLDAEVTDRAFEFGMPEQKLDRAQVLRPAVDQGRLRPPQRVRPYWALSSPICLTQESTIRAYCRVDRCTELRTRLGKRLSSEVSLA